MPTFSPAGSVSRIWDMEMQASAVRKTGWMVLPHSICRQVQIDVSLHTPRGLAAFAALAALPRRGDALRAAQQHQQQRLLRVRGTIEAIERELVQDGLV